MGVLLTGREIIDMAVSIEESGAAFYDQLATLAKKEKPSLMSSSCDAGSYGRRGAAAMYSRLAEREREHMKTFQSMLRPAGDYVNLDSYTEEYDLYLKNLVDSAVFKNERSARKAAQNASSESEALDIGIQAEKDSILFYSAIQGLVRREDGDVVGAIIKEEKSHLAQLSDLKTKLGKSARLRQSRRAG